jgi:hypothetical protein
MKTIVNYLVCTTILAASGAICVRAAETPTSSSHGKVLILKNEYTFEGDIERFENRYRVRGKGGETWVPADRVQVVVDSLEDAYAYLRKRINLDDGDERLGLARWCFSNNLQAQGMAELQAAARLRPEHIETRRLLEYWQQTASKPSKSPESRSVKPTAETEQLPPLEVTNESLGVFVTRVQPILMNTCARCHATGKGGAFHLSQVYEDSIGNRRTMERNLTAVLRQVDLTHPESSMFLVKAVSDHAHTGQAPIRDRQSAPYRTLEQWVKLTVANNPHLRDRLLDQSATSAALPLETEKQIKNGEGSQWGAESRVAADKSSTPIAKPKPQTPMETARTATSASPSPLPLLAPVDPYDPEIFNRRMHPESSKAAPAKE